MKLCIRELREFIASVLIESHGFDTEVVLPTEQAGFEKYIDHSVKHLFDMFFTVHGTTITPKYDRNAEHDEASHTERYKLVNSVMTELTTAMYDATSSIRKHPTPEEVGERVSKALVQRSAVKRTPQSVLAQIEKDDARNVERLSRQGEGLPPTEVPAESEEEAGLGKYAFPKARKLSKAAITADPDTKFEEKLFWRIDAFLTGSSQTMSTKDIEFIKKCMQSGWYKDTFKQPSVPDVWRGLRLSAAQLQKLLGDKKFDPSKHRGETVAVSKSVKSAASGKKVASWTKSEEVVNSYANMHPEDAGDQQFAIILTASTAENPANFWDIDQLLNNPHSHEEEVIAVDPVVKISSVTIL